MIFLLPGCLPLVLKHQGIEVTAMIGEYSNLDSRYLRMAATVRYHNWSGNFNSSITGHSFAVITITNSVEIFGLLRIYVFPPTHIAPVSYSSAMLEQLLLILI